MRHNIKNIILIITFIWLGCIAIIAQTLCVREIMVIFFGNEVCLGIIFTAWLLGIALGAFLASHITDKIESPTPLLAALLLLIIVVLPFQVYFIRVIRLILNIPIGQHIRFFDTVYTSLILVMPFSIIIGIAFPVACKIYALLKEYTIETHAATQIGWVYIWESLGSLIGGVLFTFYLVERFSVFEIILFSNFISLTISFLVFLIAPIKPLKLILLTKGKTLFLTSTKFLIIFLILVVFNLIVTLNLSTYLEDKSISKRWQSVSGENITLVKSIDSKYGNIAIGRLNEQYCLIENGKYVSSFPDEYTYAPLAHLFLTQHPQPQDILLIGGGIEGLIKETLKYPFKSIHYVQLDPKIIELVTQYLPEEDRRLLDADKRLQIHYIDGRRFIKETSNKFDLIIINLPDPSTAMINRFYTIDFFREVKSRLNKGGVIITRISSAVNYFSETVSDYTGSVYDTLTSVFKYVLVTPGTEAYFFASDEPDTVTFDINKLDQRYRFSGVESKYFISPASFEIMLPEWHIKLTEQALKEKKKRYLNTDLQPITYFFNLILWNTITQDKTSTKTFFRLLSEIKFRWLIILLLISLIIRVIYIRLVQSLRIDHQRTNILASIFVIGLSALSLEIVIILAFQNIYGYLYQQIGFIVALFMAGLAIGGYVSNKIVSSYSMEKTNLRDYFKAIIIIHIILLAISFFLPYILPVLSKTSSFYISSSITIFLLMIFIGMLTGMGYPLISHIYLQSGANIGKTAGLIDSFDHLGACLGAILTGVFFIPILGIEKTCIWLAILNLLPVLFIVTTMLSSYNPNKR